VHRHAELEPHFAAGQVLDDVGGVGQASGEPVQPRHDQGVAGSAGRQGLTNAEAWQVILKGNDAARPCQRRGPLPVAQAEPGGSWSRRRFRACRKPGARVSGSRKVASSVSVHSSNCTLGEGPDSVLRQTVFRVQLLTTGPRGQPRLPRRARRFGRSRRRTHHLGRTGRYGLGIGLHQSASASARTPGLHRTVTNSAELGSQSRRNCHRTGWIRLERILYGRSRPSSAADGARADERTRVPNARPERKRRPSVARRLMADHGTTGATAANMVATAAVEFCRAYGVQL